jgi:hypothetical protein
MELDLTSEEKFGRPKKQSINHLLELKIKGVGERK